MNVKVKKKDRRRSCPWLRKPSPAPTAPGPAPTAPAPAPTAPAPTAPEDAPELWWKRGHDKWGKYLPFQRLNVDQVREAARKYFEHAGVGACA